MATFTRTVPGSDEWAVTLALLRFGSDTRGARTLKELARTTPHANLLAALAAALDVDAAAGSPELERARTRARVAVRKAAHARLSILPWFAPAYPALLREIPDPPAVLWCAGAFRHLAQPAVAIVGSRRAAPAGLAVARTLAGGLSQAGLVVVSGLARGIDAAAHQGALDAGGATVGVLGCGADVAYPPEHAPLIRRLAAAGAVITEFPPGTPPLARHFPLRNRIISGLCRAVVVVEASVKSGSLITARAALEQGREVLAVPGTVCSGQYAGCHALIKDGAGLVETVEDVLDAIGWPRRPRAVPRDDGKGLAISKLEAAMAVGEPYTIDELAARTGLSGPALLAELGALEVTGLVGRLPGAGFVKLDKSAIGGGNG